VLFSAKYFHHSELIFDNSIMRNKKALSHDPMLFLEELPLSNLSEDLLDYNSICKAALQQLSSKKQFVRQ